MSLLPESKPPVNLADQPSVQDHSVPDHAPLAARLAAFEFDDGPRTLTFLGRLARENGWSAEFAARVATEYKRFALLAMVAGHSVTPSDQVDQCWHLHLTYTRSYWERFCPLVLGRSLHHEPTQGGPEQHQKFWAQYQQTLSSYERIFGQPAPADIWPPAAVRFGSDLHQARVNTNHYWLLPKIRLPRLPRLLRPTRTGVLAGCLLALVGLVGCQVQVQLNPFDFRGMEFLTFFGGMFAIGLVAANVVRWLAREPSDLPPELLQQPDPELLAYLHGGEKLVLTTALAKLIHAKQVLLVTKKTPLLMGLTNVTTYRLERGEPLPDTATPIERAFYVNLSPTGASIASLFKVGAPLVNAVRDRARVAGLAMSSGNEWFARLGPALIFALILLIGAVKVWVGIEREKPVGFLIFSCFVTVATIAIFASLPAISRRGTALLKRMTDAHKPLKDSVRHAETLLTPLQLALAVSLFGTAVLDHGLFKPLHAAVMADASSGGGGGGCGGGGDGGGGGCGGGGCGGCG